MEDLTKEEEVELGKQIAKEISVSTEKKGIPREYIPVEFASKGDLKNTPKVLHVKGFTMQSGLDLNVIEEEDQIPALINVVNDLIYEEFDVKNLHPNDLNQILMTIYASFISKKISKQYYYDEDLPDNLKDKDDNIGTVEIDIGKLSIKSIRNHADGSTRSGDKKNGAKLSEPFMIFDPLLKKTFGFRLNRVEDYITCQTYAEEFYKEALLHYKPLKREIYRIAREAKTDKERKEKLDEIMKGREDEFEDYKNFIEYKYNTLLAKIAQVCLIDGYMTDEKEYIPYKTFEEKLEAYASSIPILMWETVDDITQEYTFGIQPEYTFFCEKLQKNITRRFQFQFDDWIPSSRQHNSKRNSVLFT